MRIALQGHARAQRAVSASRLHIWTSLRLCRHRRQISAMNEAILSKNFMDKITYSQETGNKRNDARTEISQRWHRRPPKIIKEPSPDHFLALRLSHDPSVISAITSIQNAIVQHSPHLERACIDPITAHLTLGVLRLPDAATKEAAQAALVNAATAAALTTPCFVTLRGIDNFRNQVVFFDLAEAQGVEAEGCGGREQVIQLAAAVRQHFGDQGLLLQADRAFVPHVTIAKLSKLQPWQRGARGTRRSPSWRQQQKKVSLEEEKESKKQQHEEEEEEEEEEVILKEEKKVATVDSGFAIEATSKHNNYNVERKKEQQLYIPKESYSAVSSISTGAVQVTELQLCAMEGRKPGEYYKLISSVRLHT